METTFKGIIKNSYETLFIWQNFIVIYFKAMHVYNTYKKKKMISELQLNATHLILNR